MHLAAGIAGSKYTSVRRLYVVQFLLQHALRNFRLHQVIYAAMIYHGMGEEDVKRIMQEPFTMIASDSGVRQIDESVPHPRGYGNNARVLGLYVRELKLISLEDAIRKMTSLPAQTFGFRDRGLIREGFAADLVIFDVKTIIDRATFDKPHQFPLGISYVLVNGAPVLENNQMTSAPPVSLFVVQVINRSFAPLPV